MGVFKKLFPKKNNDEKDSKLTSEAKLRTLTHKLNLQIKDYDKKSRLCKLKAKKFLKAGNRVAAKNMLARGKRFEQKINQYSAIIMKAERRLDAINQAGNLKEVSSAMKTSATDLKAASSELDLQGQMESDAEAEEAIEEIEEVGDLYGADPELDYGIDIDEDFAQLEAELMFEKTGGLPDAPEEEVGESDLAGISMSLEDEEEEAKKDSKKLEEEISKLKEGLE